MKLFIPFICVLFLFGCNKAKIESKPNCNNVIKEIRTINYAINGTFYIEKDSTNGYYYSPYDTLFTNVSFYYVKDTIRKISRTEKYRYLYKDYLSTINKVIIGQIERKDTAKITNIGNEWTAITNTKYYTLTQQFTTNSFGVITGGFQHKDFSLGVDNTYDTNGFLSKCVSIIFPNATRLSIPVTNDFIRDVNNNVIQIKSSSTRETKLTNITYYYDNRGILPFNSIDYFQGFTSELLKPFFMSKSSPNLPKKITRATGEILDFEYFKDNYGRINEIKVTRKWDLDKPRDYISEIKILYECQ